jgi:hypothetical protein
MTCPNCHLENPPAALRCDCGYQFATVSGQYPSVSGVRLCQGCGRQIPVAVRFCSFCGAGSILAAPPRATKKSPGALVIGLVAAGICIFLWSKVSPPDGIGKSLSTEREVTYIVDGSASSASLTYRNESGGTEQRTVSLPWRLEMRVAPGQFLYVSAQKKQKYGTVKTTIYLEEKMLQEAESDTEYGIASASGRAPR